MSQLTLQLPETLYEQLARLAKDEGISLDQYIVYALTRQVSSSYSVQVFSKSQVEQQEQDLQKCIASSALCSEAESAEILAEREPIEGEPELSEEVIARFQTIIHSQKST